MRIAYISLMAVIAAVAIAAVSGGETAPGAYPSVATLAAPDEPGERLIVRGRVFDPSGTRPVAGVTVYAYHTAVDGRYNVPDAREPRLRARVTTDREGRFELRTIRPGSYPGRRDPAHIHMQVSGGGYPEQWVDDLEFSDDPNVTAERLAASKAKGRFAPIVTTTRDANGVQHATINIRLRNTARR